MLRQELASLDKPRQAYEFLTQHSISNQSFSVDDVATAIGWKRRTPETYIRKLWKDFLDVRSMDEIRVKPEFQRVTEQKFLELVTQRRKVFANYQRVKYDSIVIYEFLLPLKREDQLRAALDDLFYTDTIRRRLREIGIDMVRTWIPSTAQESEDDYLNRVCELIADKFGGYSI